MKKKKTDLLTVVMSHFSRIKKACCILEFFQLLVSQRQTFTPKIQSKWKIYVLEYNTIRWRYSGKQLAWYGGKKLRKFYSSTHIFILKQNCQPLASHLPFREFTTPCVSQYYLKGKLLEFRTFLVEIPNACEL